MIFLNYIVFPPSLSSLPYLVHFNLYDILKTIVDVNIVGNTACDLERSPKVKICKNAPIMFKLNTILNKNHKKPNKKKNCPNGPFEERKKNLEILQSQRIFK